MRIISFSADGIAAAAEKGFYDWLIEQDADFICIQDLQCSEYDLQDNVFFPGDYNAYFFDDVGGKANGVAIYCRKMPKAIMTGLGFVDFDMEGRYIQADYENLSVGCLLAPRAEDDNAEQQARKSEFFGLLQNHMLKIQNKRTRLLMPGMSTPFAKLTPIATSSAGGPMATATAMAGVRIFRLCQRG